ncbi:small subunit processome component 20 homolog [Sabethes cyaneus]|uniref:small subunit processome component 20 homolog n=1 Tax=Sabethes cyaneus TaxID=53552 RepID=UPI00237E921F|nr:small subunit processome component 20 homolog [Sabethes cyaneus]
MKNSMPKCKSKSMFQFKSLRERIAEIDIRRSALYSIGHENEELENDQSHFHEAVQKWRVLNLTEDFQQFIMPIRSIVSLPQLLHKKTFVLEHLLMCLQKASCLSIQALLEILVALAKDLRAEFCPYFFQFFDKLIVLLDTRDSEILEHTFLCLAVLLKTLRGFLRKKLDQIFKRLVQMLEESKPLYITNFAAECFGFLARDIANKKELIYMISTAAGKNSSLSSSCGRFLFEIMRGINGQLHSCAEQYWRLLLLEVINEKPNRENDFDPQYLHNILIQTVTDMLQCVEPDNMEPFWRVIYTALDIHLVNNPISNEMAFHCILQLIGLIAEYQHGNYLQNIPCLIGKLIKTIDGTESEAILSTISKIATLLMSSNLCMTQLEVSRLTKNVMTLGTRSRNVFEEFVLNVVDSSMFEILVLPDYLKYLEKGVDFRGLKLLMKIVLQKSRPCKSGMDLNNWKRIPIKLKCDEAIRKILQVILGGQRAENQENFYACITLLPHLKDFDIDNKILYALEKEVYSTLVIINANPESCYISALSTLIETLVHLNYPDIQLFLETVKRLLPVITSSRKESLINIVNLCLVHISLKKSEVLDDVLFKDVHAHLCEFLASIHHCTRLLVTHTFTLFSKLTTFALDADSETLFSLLHSIESIEPDIHNYRKQVMLLKKLEYDSNLFQTIKNPEFQVDAMRTVISLLSINFNLLWKPASEVLLTYAEGFSVKDFWSVYKQQLNCTLEVANNNVFSDICQKQHSNYENQSINDQYEKIDYLNYRVQLLDCLSRYSRIFEAKNRDIVESFLRFLEEEYRPKKSSAGEKNEDTPKATQKILIAYLNIFSNVRDPRTIFKARQLYEIFLELLCHRSSEVQRLALSCIFTYDNPAFMPYKENLYRLNCSKSFKQEIITFFKRSMDEENEHRCIIQDNHRSEVIPLVMKILHTKMIDRTTPAELKMLIVRFLGNFKEEEIKLFINMSFDCFEKLLKTHPMETYIFIKSEDQRPEDLTIHRLQALISLLENIFEEVAALKNENFIQYLLHVKFCMDAIFLQMDHSLVKHLKSQATLNLVNFFSHYNNYEWSAEEIEAVFLIYVWPNLNKLDSDSIHSPTPLLKLFSAWSTNLRYFPLLVKHGQTSPLDISCTPLEKIINLLTNGKASDAVCQEICRLIISMLSMESTDNGNGYVLPMQNMLISDKYDVNEKQNVGCLLLSAYFIEILNYIQKVMKENRSISKDLLNILSYVSEYAKESILCDTLADMLFPMITRKCSLQKVDSELIRELIQVLNKLLQFVSHVEKYKRQIGLLLERVNDLDARKVVLQIIDLLVRKCDDAELVRYTFILHDLNAMDKRWLDQPDFSRRLNAFRKMNELAKEETVINVEAVIWIVHQCFYYLKIDHDLAIRDNANQFLRTIAIHCIKTQHSAKRDSVQYLIERVILPALIRGVKDKNETVRYESIQLLGELSRQCADYHYVFADLHPFTNEIDREIDFFDNITHLQSHRHRRALKRFHKIMKSLDKTPSTRTLVDFALPIVSTYLCNESYKKKAKLTEAAGKCVALIGRMLPWPSYKMLLKQYLNRMKHSIDYQKQLIKIVVGLLDNFRYDVFTAKVNCKSTQLFLNNTIVEESAKKLDNDENGEDKENYDEENQFSNAPLLKEDKEVSIIDDILKGLIPDLFSAIHYKEMSDTIKLNERKERYAREKRDMLKIPLAIAIVKLFQKLPDCVLEQELPKLFIRVINFLKSNLKQVRSTARETLKSMLVAVGPEYLKAILDDLSAILKRGFQVQVLTSVVYTLLDAVKDRLSAPIIDDIMQLVLNMCINDIFGLSSDGKDVNVFSGKTSERKSSKKSFLILYIMANKMSEKSTLDLIIPFKQVISKTNSRKTIVKAQEVLSKIADGICCNSNITVESLLTLVYGITSENIPYLVCDKRKITLSERQMENRKREIQDIHLIPVEPRRKSATFQNVSASATNANTHILVEMGLEILDTLLRRSQISLTEYDEFLVPLIPFLVDSMNSNHIKIITLSVKCIASIWSIKTEIPCVVNSVAIVVDNLLKLLQKYAASGIARTDENFHLIKNCFKAIVTLMKFVKYFTISTAQLKLLLLYVEQDLMHPDRQHMALILLRSIVGRKLACEEMVSIIKKIADLSIMNDNDKFREECRRVVLDYLIGYPLGSNVEHTVNFYVSQLEYEMLSGRESAVLMLQAMFKSFPMELLSKKGNYLFYALGIRLINEKSADCKILVATSLETLLSILTKKQRDNIANLVLVMLSETKLSERELAAQFLIRMINVEKEAFMLRAKTVLPALLNSMVALKSESAGKFVLLKQIEIQDYGEEFQDLKDHSLYQILNVFSKLFEVCPQVIYDENYANTMDELAYSLQSLLSYGHQWIRYASLQLIGAFLASIDTTKVQAILKGEQCSFKHRFIYNNPTKAIRSLVLDMCSQLNPGQTDEETASLIVKNFVILCYILADMPFESSNDEKSKDINLNWIMRRVRYVIQSEVSKTPKSIVLRNNMFNLFDSVIDLTNSNTMRLVAPSMMSPMLRELNDKDHLNEELKTKITALMRKIRTKIGLENYDVICLNIKAKIEGKRRARHLSKAVEKINNPVQATKRKQAMKDRKKLAKKRKLDTQQVINRATKKPHKIRRLEDLFQN